MNEATEPSLQLGALLVQGSALDTLTTDFVFGDITFKVRYMHRTKLRALGEKHTRRVYDGKTRSHRIEPDADKFFEAIITGIVAGWSGATLERVSKLMPINVPEGKEQVELPFSPENLMALVRNTLDLDTALQEVAMDAKLFRPVVEQESAVKN